MSTLETVKHRKMYGTNLCFLGNKKPEVSSERGKNLINQVEHFNMRV